MIRNNVFAYGVEAQVMRTRDEEHLSFTLTNNILLANGAPLLGSNWNGDVNKFALNRNVYWDVSGSVTFAGKSLDEWRKKGIDGDSVVADPQFTDPAHGDFTLKPGSPALALGFKPLDLAEVGARPAKASGVLSAYLPTHQQQSAAAPRLPAFPPKPLPPPPSPIADGFEDTPVGQKAAGAVTSEDGAVAAATVRVTDSTAASGKRCLKFTDAPGQRNTFDPHLYYEPHFTAGMMTGSFAIRLEPGAVLMHEWRSAGQPYHTGPALVIDDGRLVAGGKELLRIPNSQWLTISITTGLGPDANGTWTLAVTLPGAKEPQRFPGLMCSRDFRTLGWYGFVNNATQATAFYIDDIALAPAPAGR